MKKTAIGIFLLLMSIFSFSQPSEIRKIEDTLKILGPSIIWGETDTIKHHANKCFLTSMRSALLREGSFEYPFDSLTTISKLTSNDKKFRIITWNLKNDNGNFEFYGFIQVWSKKAKKYILYSLNDNSDNITTPETQILETQNWYGAHYYKIIETKYRGKKYYTLLGWDGNNLLTKKKIIEALTFNSSGKPIFGAPIFKYSKKTYKRVIFEYSANTSMALNFDKQSTAKGNKKRKMIVFDRLAPVDKSLEGVYQFYYPETNIFDAFMFKNGKWIFVKDIDARNNENSKERKEQKRKIIQEQKEHQRK